ncbi:hypothetical protein WMY93_009085 [Mugilogobius chulae]|uniref:Uncharacterized protein n=1 Tax=Mugilogobius chulae TaxID=88201 RepID=A0AAW0PJD8_9GOBI
MLNQCLSMEKSRSIGRTLIPRYFSTVFEGGVSDLHYILKHSKESFHNSCITLDCDQCTMVTSTASPCLQSRRSRSGWWKEEKGRGGTQPGALKPAESQSALARLASTTPPPLLRSPTLPTFFFFLHLRFSLSLFSHLPPLLCTPPTPSQHPSSPREIIPSASCLPA